MSTRAARARCQESTKSHRTPPPQRGRYPRTPAQPTTAMQHALPAPRTTSAPLNFWVASQKMFRQPVFPWGTLGNAITLTGSVVLG
eukprot:6716460-Prymnesium_polylepis.2